MIFFYFFYYYFFIFFLFLFSKKGWKAFWHALTLEAQKTASMHSQSRNGYNKDLRCPCLFLIPLLWTGTSLLALLGADGLRSKLVAKRPAPAVYSHRFRGNKEFSCHFTSNHPQTFPNPLGKAPVTTHSGVPGEAVITYMVRMPTPWAKFKQLE